MKRSLLLIALFACAALATQHKAMADEQPTAADAAATGETAADATTPEEPKAEETTPAENTADNVEKSDVAHMQDATLRIRTKLGEIDKKLGELTKPGRSLLSQCASTKNKVSGNLPAMDRLAKEVVELQEEFNRAGAAAYDYTEVTPDGRESYAQDGAAAYKAMLVDMKEKKSRRKVGGLDKFELMRARYQGVPEYKQAYERYLKTLKELDKKWHKMLDTETARRKGYAAAKKEALEKADQEELEKLSDFFSKNGEDISVVWYNPSPRNMAMLRNCTNKVEDALRRNKPNEFPKGVGTVPELQQKFWQTMDDARQAMMTGDLEGAERMLKDDENFRNLTRLNTSMLPSEYKEPMVNERSKMLQEIQKRSRAYRATKATLDRKSGTLERMISNAEAQIENTLAAIELAIDLDAGEKTAEVVDETADGDKAAETDQKADAAEPKAE